MHNVFALKRAFASNIAAQMAIVLIVAVLMWATGLPMALNSSKAAALTFVSDTLTDSDLGVRSGHTIEFTVQTALNDLGGADTIQVILDPATSLFDITDLDVADFTNESGIDIVSACGGGGSEATLATTSDTFTLSMCTGDTIATSTAVAFTIASSTSIITNPSVADSYVIRIQTRNQGTTILDAADTRVMILDDVTVTASVDTIFEFTVAGLASGTSINGDTTSTTTTATAIGFGTLTPGNQVIAGQRLNVETNARNGFSVTIKLDQNLTSSTGADIDMFIDGGGQSTPVAWIAPSNSLASGENTYGHFGVTSEDSTLSGGDPFGTQLYAGNFSTTTLEVFYHNGPADNTTADEGETDVAYQIEIESLQEAGTDYTAQLTYVATPQF